MFCAYKDTAEVKWNVSTLETLLNPFSKLGTFS